MRCSNVRAGIAIPCCAGGSRPCQSAAGIGYFAPQQSARQELFIFNFNISQGRTAGKLVGSALGLWLGGPLGAIAGLLVGHIHDTRPDEPNEVWSGLWNHAGLGGNIEQAAFTMGVVVLGAKMAKADGRVTRTEIEAFKRVFRIAPDNETAIGALFDRARLSATGFEPYAFQLAHVFRRDEAVLEEVLSGLFAIAASDSAGLSAAEVTFLKRVAFIFGFGIEDFNRIAARSGVHLPERERPRGGASEPFEILGIRENAGAEEIKAAYRALIREHHPDKLTAAGMPPEFVDIATEKMKRINAAYDTVCKLRGIK